MATQQDLDPVAVATLVASTLFGPAVAGVVGPYAVIIIAALTGAAWSLSKREPEPSMAAMWFLLRIVFTATLLTVGISASLEKWVFTDKGVTWLLVPVAFGIGWIGDDWPEVLKWIGVKLKQIADMRFNKQGGDHE